MPTPWRGNLAGLRGYPPDVPPETSGAGSCRTGTDNQHRPFCFGYDRRLYLNSEEYAHDRQSHDALSVILLFLEEQILRVIAHDCEKEKRISHTSLSKSLSTAVTYRLRAGIVSRA